jgi:hypothetical protein
MNYSSLIKTPEGDDFKKTAEYQKALDGKKSTAISASPPLGRRYLINTKFRCNNTKNNRYIFINAKPNVSLSTISSINQVSVDSLYDKNVLKQLPKNSIYYSAIRDLSRVSERINSSIINDCEKKSYTTIDENGKTKIESQYVKKESFVTPSLQNMNAGQQFFIGSFTVLGLLLFYKAFLKR